MNRQSKYINVFLVSSICLLFSTLSKGQSKIRLNALLDSIDRNHPVSRMYEADIRSMDEAAKGAKSWMPPEIGAGLFMTPYNTKRWKALDSGMEEGMGSFMISIQQMIPNPGKLNADQAYMRSMSGAAREERQSSLNNLYAQAKKAYYEWMVIEKKKTVVQENEKVLEFMIKNAEIRYKNGLDKISAYYKAKAALSNVQSMRIMLKNESEQRRIAINTLMNRNVKTDFTIDTVIGIKEYDNIILDSTFFLQNRSDLKAIEREVITNQLRIKSEQKSLKPQFGVRFEHMFAFGSQPQQFTLMGMVRLPMVPWASKMTKSNVESYKWRTEALNSQRQMILNEISGMANGMRTEIETKKKQVALFENNIVPALRNNYKTMLLAYEQNTEELFMLFDAWETLNMTQVEYLDQLQQLLSLQVELERVLQIKQ